MRSCAKTMPSSDPYSTITSRKKRISRYFENGIMYYTMDTPVTFTFFFGTSLMEDLF
jgi:hypothetical protein